MDELSTPQPADEVVPGTGLAVIPTTSTDLEIPTLPLPLLVVPMKHRVAVWTKFFGAMTVLTLAVSVLVGFVLVIQGAQAEKELTACKAAASQPVSAAFLEKDLAQSVLTSLNAGLLTLTLQSGMEGYEDKLAVVVEEIRVAQEVQDDANTVFAESVITQQLAVKDCER